MRLLSTKIKNILSISEIHYEFKESAGLVLLSGWNHDDQTANGAGKTSFINAISFALYGKAPRKITISDFLRKGQKKVTQKFLLNAVTTYGRCVDHGLAQLILLRMA